MLYRILQDITTFKKGVEVTMEELQEVFSDKYINTLIVSKCIEEFEGLPKTWEELETISGYYIDGRSSVCVCNNATIIKANRNIFPTKEEAEACIALAQLCQLRDRYNDGWKPNHRDGSCKFYVYFHGDNITTNNSITVHRVLTFKTLELAHLFMLNFEALLKIAKPLL